MEIIIKEIPYVSADYRKSLELRNKALRVPLGMNLFNEDLSRDAGEMHVGAYRDGELAGILILAGMDDKTVQMRQVAVDEAYRGEGIGARMVSFSEELARRSGYSKIILHARETAVPFYKRLGYKVTGEQFTEVGIPHREMGKAIVP